MPARSGIWKWVNYSLELGYIKKSVDSFLENFLLHFFLSVRTLIELKADLGLANKLHWDWTPIHTAVMADDPDVVDTLVKAGADRDAKDGVGRDAETLAEEYRKERVMEYFKKGKARAKK